MLNDSGYKYEKKERGYNKFIMSSFGKFSKRQSTLVVPSSHVVVRDPVDELSDLVDQFDPPPTKKRMIETLPPASPVSRVKNIVADYNSTCFKMAGVLYCPMVYSYFPVPFDIISNFNNIFIHDFHSCVNTINNNQFNPILKKDYFITPKILVQFIKDNEYDIERAYEQLLFLSENMYYSFLWNPKRWNELEGTMHNNMCYETKLDKYFRVKREEKQERETNVTNNDQ